MSRMIRIICIFGFVAVCLFLRHSPKNPGHLLAPLRAEPASLDLGEVWPRRDFHHEISITCTHRDPVHIESFTTSCNCTQIEPSSMTIDPGETKSLRLKLDLSAFVQVEPTIWTRPISISTLPVVADGSPPSGTWQLTGRLRFPLAISNPRVTLPEIDEAGSIAFPVTRIETTKAADIASVTVRCDESFGKLQSEETGRVVIATVTPRSDLPGGLVQFPVEFIATTDAGEVLPAVEVLVEGYIRPDLYATPSQIVNGVMEVGQVISQTVKILSRSNRPFTVVDVECPSETHAVPQGEAQQGGQFHIEHVCQQQTDERIVVFRCRYVSDGSEREIPLKIVYAVGDSGP